MDVYSFARPQLATEHVPVPRVDRHLSVGLGYVCYVSDLLRSEASPDRVRVIGGSRKSRLCRQTRPEQ